MAESSEEEEEEEEEGEGKNKKKKKKNKPRPTTAPPPTRASTGLGDVGEAWLNVGKREAAMQAMAGEVRRGEGPRLLPLPFSTHTPRSEEQRRISHRMQRMRGGKKTGDKHKRPHTAPQANNRGAHANPYYKEGKREQVREGRGEGCSVMFPLWIDLPCDVNVEA
jgi:hypothetical protein